MLNSPSHPSRFLQTVARLHRSQTRRWHFCTLFYKTSLLRWENRRWRLERMQNREDRWRGERKWVTFGGSDLINPSPSRPRLFTSSLAEDKTGFRGESVHRFSTPACRHMALRHEKINLWHHQQTLYQVTQTRASRPSGARERRSHEAKLRIWTELWVTDKTVNSVDPEQVIGVSSISCGAWLDTELGNDLPDHWRAVWSLRYKDVFAVVEVIHHLLLLLLFFKCFLLL